MTELQNSNCGRVLNNACILTREEINKIYPITDNSRMAHLTREFSESGYDILYGENPNMSKSKMWDCLDDVVITAACLYQKSPECIKVGAFTDISSPNIIYAAVKLKD